MSAALATIGHNGPPEPTPFEIVANSTDAVFEEAKHWLDGKKVESQAEADAIAQLLDVARETAKLAKDTKDAEKRPHLDANAAIEERFRPVVKRIDLVTSGCKAALAPWELAREAERRAVADAARREAEEKAWLAQEAVRAASQAGIEEREAAEAMLRDAKKASATATKAENAKSTTKVGDRALSLRTTYVAEITDTREFARFAWVEHNDEMLAFLATLAQRLVNSGRRTIPGVNVREQRSAA